MSALAAVPRLFLSCDYLEATFMLVQPLMFMDTPVANTDKDKREAFLKGSPGRGIQGDDNSIDDRVLNNPWQRWLHRDHFMGRVVG